jgi:signal transduction histidine kinase
MSLLGNSVYAIVKKAKREAAQPELRLALIVGESATVTIRDTGIGIEKAIIDKVFDPFFTTKTTSEAAGVGLYLSREIVQNHGGDITVKSVKDEYSEFTITLPYKK